MNRVRALTALAAAMLATGAAADPQLAPPLPPGSWNVDWGHRRCALIRQSESSPPSFFAIQVVPGGYRSDLRVVSQWPRGAISEPERLAISFHPQGWTVPGELQVQRTEAGHAVAILDATEEAREAFAAAQSVRVSRDGVTLLEIPLPGSSRALEAFRECEESVMREWGIDPAARAAVRIPPRGNLASFVENNDYPLSALRRNIEGDVVFQLDVDRNGRVTSCRILESSGAEILDERSCGVMRRRARLEPARGHDGTAIPATVVGVIRWRIMR